ncbi:ESX-1 secretion-associated protein [Amycolatopsis sp. RTGN1]|uniref:ESX-1 secretion-associated protein n=1 Tax=Amycolatopsis ponsaeliensis TaxID=2992142 RepID=UPI00254EBFEF|nr:ESX-1 secretion-associated protein [Amycolatopsis sp. RTGN1]
MPDGAGGYQVEIDALRQYVGVLGKYQDQGAKFTEKVGRSDVGDKSWGVVGLFTKHGYDETLHELRDLLASMAEGLTSAQGKFTDAANVYQGTEDDHKAFFGQVEVLLDGPKQP